MTQTATVQGVTVNLFENKFFAEKAADEFRAHGFAVSVQEADGGFYLIARAADGTRRYLVGKLTA